jgi:hypothetical protein
VLRKLLTGTVFALGGLAASPNPGHAQGRGFGFRGGCFGFAGRLLLGRRVWRVGGLAGWLARRLGLGSRPRLGVALV